MAQVKLKEEQEEPAEGEQSVQTLEDNSPVLCFRKEEPEEVEINAEPLQLRVIQVSVKSEEEEPESSPHQTAEDETREDAGSEKHPGREGRGNSSDSDNSKGLSPAAETPQTHSNKRLQGPSRRNRVGADDRDSSERHSCSRCGERFGTITKLTAHEQTHAVEKPFKCEFCEKRFPLKHRLNDHMRTHMGEKPYQCSICQMRFTWMSRLYTHMKSHTGERSFRCPICADVFTRNCHLQQHMRIHSGEKLF